MTDQRQAQNRSAKYESKARVLSQLEKVTDKELSKAESILSSIVHDLSKQPGFIKTSVLSKERQRQISAVQASFGSAQKIIGSMSKSMNIASARILTAVTAIMMPANCFEKGSDVSQRDFCHLLGINRQSKYFEVAAQQNWAARGQNPHLEPIFTSLDMKLGTRMRF